MRKEESRRMHSGVKEKIKSQANSRKAKEKKDRKSKGEKERKQTTVDRKKT